MTNITWLKIPSLFESTMSAPTGYPREPSSEPPRITKSSQSPECIPFSMSRICLRSREKEFDTEWVLDVVSLGLDPSRDCSDFSDFIVTLDSGLLDNFYCFDSDLFIAHTVFDKVG